MKINHTLTGSLGGVQPVSSSISASFIGWSSGQDLGVIEEIWYNSSVDGRKIQGWIAKPPGFDKVITFDCNHNLLTALLDSSFLIIN